MTETKSIFAKTFQAKEGEWIGDRSCKDKQTSWRVGEQKEVPYIFILIKYF